MHHTKHIGNIAETITTLALQKLGFVVFSTTQDDSPVDLVALDTVSGRTLRVQVKYRTNGYVPKVTAWADRHGSHTRAIQPHLIDYFAMVHDDRICFVSPEMMGKTIRFDEPNAATPYFWWEDFSIDGPIPSKRKRTGYQIQCRDFRSQPRITRRKVDRPSAAELEALLSSSNYSEVGRMYGVSDNAIRKWQRSYRLGSSPE